MLFGASMKGKARPFNYTGYKIVGPQQFKKQADIELARVKTLKGTWANFPNGYQERYKDQWADNVRIAVQKRKRILSVIHLMSHVVKESKKLYAGTDAADRFMIFHDHLSCWWENDAQAYLRDILKFPLDRQMRAEGATNENNRYYKNKLVGNSPEMCRALDSHGFAVALSAKWSGVLCYQPSMTSMILAGSKWTRQLRSHRLWSEPGLWSRLWSV